jgi:hypothetical protein
MTNEITVTSQSDFQEMLDNKDFKIAKITSQQKDMLINFLNNQQSSIRIGPALATWITSAFYRTQDYFFVDHDEMSWLTMLSLVHPGLIRKTQQIIQAK